MTVAIACLLHAPGPSNPGAAGPWEIRPHSGQEYQAMPTWVPDAIFYEIIPDRLEPPTAEELQPYSAEAFESFKS